MACVQPQPMRRGLREWHMIEERRVAAPAAPPPPHAAGGGGGGAAEECAARAREVRARVHERVF